MACLPTSYEVFTMFGPARNIFTISEITKDLKGLIEDNFSSVWLKGEISNLKTYASGHIYFTLKDEGAQLSAVMFRGQNSRLKFRLENGMAVIVHGRLSLFEQRGQYQIIVDNIEPDGIGDLQLAFEQLKERLNKEGFFESARKQPLPLLPRRIGIVTSLHGAVLHDMLTIIKRRFDSMDVLVFPVKVQGDGAAQEIAAAIDYFSQNKNADVLIVGRGGGSLEDLWAFNEEGVARAVFNCTLPVVSAVGHETDFSICDFVADVRAPTPSAAAELCTPVKAELLQQIDNNRLRLYKNLQSNLKSLAQQLKFLIKNLPSPTIIVDRIRLKISDCENRLNLIVERLLEKKRFKLGQSSIKITLLNPKNILKRGYVIVHNSARNVITRKNHLSPGDEVELTFHDGVVTAKTL